MTKLDLLIQRNYLTVFYLEIPVSKNLYHCFANQLTGFYVIQGFTERYFSLECTRLSITFKFNTSTFLLFTCSFLLIWKIWSYDWPRGKEIHNVNWTSLVFQHSLVQASIALHSLNLFLFNVVQYFNVLFHWKEKSLFVYFELCKGVYYRFLKKECFFHR